MSGPKRNFLHFSTGLHSVAIAFLGLPVDHWCEVSELENLSAEQQKYIAAPYEENGQFL